MKTKKLLLLGIGGSSFFILLSIALMFLYPPVRGVEFTGGTSVSFSYDGVAELPTRFVLEEQIKDISESFILRSHEEDGYLLESVQISEEKRRELNTLLTASAGEGSVDVSSYTTIGPSISSELVRNSIVALFLGGFIIVLYIAYTFRFVSYPVSSWKYGAVAFIALLHDILIPSGVYSVLTTQTDARIDTLFVTALLAIIGYSINDTIVVFDRIRENLRSEREKGREAPFEETVRKSIMQSIPRSINTSLTTILALGAIYFIGGETTQWFSLIILIGVLVGTYSSLVFAPSILILLKRGGKRRKKEDEEETKEYRKAEKRLFDSLDNNS